MLLFIHALMTGIFEQMNLYVLHQLGSNMCVLQLTDQLCKMISDYATV